MASELNLLGQIFACEIYMITVEQLFDVLSNAKAVASNQILAECPFCGERKFYIHKFKGLFDCKKCNESGNIFQLLSHTGHLELLEGHQVADLDHLENKLNIKQPDEVVDLSVPKTITLPIGSEYISWTSKTLEAAYLRKRNFTEQDFELYKPFKNILINNFQRYAIISIEQEFNLCGFVGRYIFDKEDEEFDANRFRYVNNKGAKFSQLLFGMDEITRNTHTLILVEGTFDKISVSNKLHLHESDDLKCLCTFGKHLSTWQINYIRYKTSIKNLIFLYDSRDAIREVKTFGSNASPYFKVFACFRKTEDDADRMSEDDLLSILHESEPIENFINNKVQFSILKR